MATRSRPQNRGADAPIRRLIDVCVAGALLVLLAPVLPAIALVVKLTSRGPALYKQIRVGRSGAPFTILKFRSMVVDADKGGPLITAHADPRITPVGAFLRATKLDELPQFINVLKGDMTLVGPRPEVPRFIPFYTEAELEVLRVRPGLTGAAQIVYSVIEAEHGATDDPELDYVNSELHEKLAIDLDYLQHRGLRRDLTILMDTCLLMSRNSRRAATPGSAAPTFPAAT